MRSSATPFTPSAAPGAAKGVKDNRSLTLKSSLSTMYWHSQIRNTEEMREMPLGYQVTMAQP
jgi:hypothetical protein